MYKRKTQPSQQGAARRIAIILVTLAIWLWTCGIATATEGATYTVAVEGDFEDIKDNIKFAIVDRGLNIANELHASEMLNKTGKDLGFPQNVFLRAESIEFCSALISHRLVIANPSNMVLCPFTISVYVLSRDPGRVHVAYRRPLAGPESQDVVKEVETLVREVVEEAVEG